ncbi:MAG: hypothetical protein CMQ58_02180 [Gammaproteobacteria bacterium]|nr:hypothetical protein [Gammaproteobacteria bacterium]
MTRWISAILLSVIVHVLIFISYEVFSVSETKETFRKITNVNFIEEPKEIIEVKKSKTVTSSKNDNLAQSEQIAETKLKQKQIENLDEYLEEEALQKKILENIDIVEQISSKVIKDIEELWIKPNNSKKGMFADFSLSLSRSGLIDDIELVQSSGNKAFDRAALNAIRKYKQVRYINTINDEEYRIYFSKFTLRFKPE